MKLNEEQQQLLINIEALIKEQIELLALEPV